MENALLSPLHPMAPIWVKILFVFALLAIGIMFYWVSTKGRFLEQNRTQLQVASASFHLETSGTLIAYDENTKKVTQMVPYSNKSDQNLKTTLSIVSAKHNGISLQPPKAPFVTSISAHTEGSLHSGVWADCEDGDNTLLIKFRLTSRLDSKLEFWNEVERLLNFRCGENGTLDPQTAQLTTGTKLQGY